MDPAGNMGTGTLDTQEACEQKQLKLRLRGALRIYRLSVQ